MRNRIEWEKIEEKILAPYGVKSSKSLGRKYPEKEHPLRTCFQRDRDRIIHSTAFRRLEYKTQVFIYHEGDYYRNRLTHTIEVQQIARTIARILRLNEDLVEAISLAHDIGHTPFGHKGEYTLDAIMKTYNTRFEHNLHGLRVVDYLEKRYPDFPGLNLTFEVREGIIRHKTSYDMPLDSDLKEFLQFKSPSLETQVVNFADEIAYTSHDLDDGLKSEVISIEELKNIELWKEISKSIKVSNEKKVKIVIRNLINFLVLDFVNQSLKNIKKMEITSLEEVRNTSPILSYSKETYEKYLQLRKFLEEKMYSHYRVIRMAEKASRIITELFHAYMKEPKQLPEHIQNRLKEEKIERVICDYIAGMTDRFAHQEYKKLFDPTAIV